MKSIFFAAVAFLTVANLAAFDLNTATPGMLFGPKDSERAKLFTDQKPVKTFLTAVSKRPTNAMIKVTADRELVFTPCPGEKTANCTVALPFPAAKNVKISFDIKCDKFFVPTNVRNDYPRFMLNVGGAYLFFRGNTKDLRYFDGTPAVKKYVRLSPMKNGEWFSVTLEVNCGDAPTFSLNGKKDIPQRSKFGKVSNITFSAGFFSADNSVTIKNLKVSAL